MPLCASSPRAWGRTSGHPSRIFGIDPVLEQQMLLGGRPTTVSVPRYSFCGIGRPIQPVLTPDVFFGQSPIRSGRTAGTHETQCPGGEVQA